MIAGPNGSGKSTIFNDLNTNYNTGVYINADELEKDLATSEGIDLSYFQLSNITQEKLFAFLERHSLYQKAISENYKINLGIVDNKIINPSKSTHSYEAALIADFLRHEVLNLGKKLTFETVMSHYSKIDIFKKSNQLGYKNYLYFISTESVDINIQRVAQRVKDGGHPVSTDKIVSRYYSSLELLKTAVNNTYRAFIFDNSEKDPIQILEVFEGKTITYNNEYIPNWVEKYLLKGK